MSKAPIVIVLCILLALPSSSVLASSTWKEAAASFANGSRYDVGLYDDHLQLNNTTAGGAWTQLSEGGPGPWAFGAYGYDPKGRILLYGGGDQPFEFQNPKDDTWIYDTVNRSWHQVFTSPNPGRRTYSGMAFDESAGKFILFGGKVYTGTMSYISADTWLFDPATEKWSNVTNSVHPSARFSSAMVYDRGAKKVLLYGGTDLTKYLSDTWSFDTSTATWTQLPNTNLPLQEDPHLVYVDSLNGSLITSMTNKTWLFNYTNDQWSPIFDPRLKSETFAGPMVYDRDHDEVFFLQWNDWIFHPLTQKWDRLDYSPSPGVLQQGVIVYDTKTKSVIVDGGLVLSKGVPAYDPMPLPYMWQYGMPNSGWFRLNVVPLNTMGSRMAYAPKSKSTLIYGGWYGIHPESHTPLADGEVWTLGPNGSYDAMDGNFSDWYRIPQFQAMEYDSDWNYLVSVGGNYNNTVPALSKCQGPQKYFDVHGRNWSTVQPALMPPCRAYGQMVYDAAAKRTVLFGGFYENSTATIPFNDTWVFDQSSWLWVEQHPALSPLARANFGMAYADSTKDVYIYGGNDPNTTRFGDLWSYDYTFNTWTNLTRPGGPGPRTGLSMVYDSVRNALVVFGGLDGGGGVIAPDLWLYYLDSSTWVKVLTTNGPSPRIMSAMAYDVANDRYILYSGRSATGVDFCDTWAYKFNPYQRTGTYTSKPFDMGGSAYFGNITWKATDSSITKLKFQVRTGATTTELLARPFLGPDGTSGSYYLQNNTRLHAFHNNSRYLQYIAYFNAMSDVPTPKLYGVNITYNLLQSVALLDPTTASSLSGNITVKWNGTDKDGDHLRYTVIISDASGGRWNMVDNTTLERLDSWNTRAVPNGNYKITVFAYDDNAAIPLVASTSQDGFTIHNHVTDHPPISLLISPFDGLGVDSLQANLEWKGDDQDNDPLTYYLFIGRDKDNLTKGTPVVITSRFYNFTGSEGTYYWTVIPNDGIMNGSCQSGIWSFKLGTINHAPKVLLLLPQNATTVKEKNVTLGWSGTDPDNDPLTYFVYLSTDIEQVRARTATAMVKQTNLTSLPKTLDKGTYFWTVIPNDGKVNGTTVSGIWSFKIDIPGPYVTCSITSPQNNSKATGKLTIEGTAAGGLGAVVRAVTVRIDGGSWSTATGTTSWSLSIDTSKLADGQHTVEAQSQSDKGLLSTTVFLVFTSRNHSQHTQVEAPYCSWVLIVIAVVAAVVVGKRYLDYRLKYTKK